MLDQNCSCLNLTMDNRNLLNVVTFHSFLCLQNNVCIKIFLSHSISRCFLASSKVHFRRQCNKWIYHFYTHSPVVKLNKDIMQNVFFSIKISVKYPCVIVHCVSDFLVFCAPLSMILRFKFIGDTCWVSWQWFIRVSLPLLNRGMVFSHQTTGYGLLRKLLASRCNVSASLYGA